jgi:hypothetical protein
VPKSHALALTQKVETSTYLADILVLEQASHVFHHPDEHLDNKVLEDDEGDHTEHNRDKDEHNGDNDQADQAEQIDAGTWGTQPITESNTWISVGDDV